MEKVAARRRPSEVVVGIARVGAGILVESEVRQQGAARPQLAAQAQYMMLLAPFL